jgi:hypothetical protein
MPGSTSFSLKVLQKAILRFDLPTRLGHLA